jgi:hypothetical protein
MTMLGRVYGHHQAISISIRGAYCWPCREKVDDMARLPQALQAR